MRGDAGFTRTMACGNTRRGFGVLWSSSHTHMRMHTRRAMRAIIRSFCGKNCHHKEQIINSRFPSPLGPRTKKDDREVRKDIPPCVHVLHGALGVANACVAPASSFGHHRKSFCATRLLLGSRDRSACETERTPQKSPPFPIQQ